MNDIPIENRIPTSPGDFERAQQDHMIADNLSKIGRKILVMSGKGGVGKSTVACYLALLLSARGYKVGLLDVDLHGPSVPRLLNVHGGLGIPDENEKGMVRPNWVSDNLGIVSMEMMLGNKDMAVIWRGPMKISAIRQFISDVEWGALDYLIIDAPPGTGDEPLTVAQTVPDAEALVVTTPQEISLADVRKSINFCREVGLRILGVLENMSEFVCPHCGKTTRIFGGGGGTELGNQMNVPFLAQIPLDPRMVDMGDNGTLDQLMEDPDLALNQAYGEAVERIINKL